jgi:hypothetical protein
MNPSITNFPLLVIASNKLRIGARKAKQWACPSFMSIAWVTFLSHLIPKLCVAQKRFQNFCIYVENVLKAEKIANLPSLRKKREASTETEPRWR